MLANLNSHAASTWSTTSSHSSFSSVPCKSQLYKLLKTLARRKVECVALEALMVPQKEVMGSRRRTYCAASCRDSICFRIGIEMLRQDAYHHQNQYHNPETRKISLDRSRSSQGSESVRIRCWSNKLHSMAQKMQPNKACRKYDLAKERIN